MPVEVPVINAVNMVPSLALVVWGGGDWTKPVVMGSVALLRVF
jgi:hypothetical protein|tara:strand:+ start:816 stop:944 length:129 start_codon:yes stop_codon:yes gene_type:complete